MVNNEITMNQLLSKTKQLIEEFKKREQRNWGIEGNMIELSKQVGELSKCVMCKEKYYLSNREKYDKEYDENKQDIGDELSDILFILLRIADHYKIDLFKEHMKQMDLALNHPIMENNNIKE